MLPRFGGQVRAVATGPEVGDGLWKEISLGDWMRGGAGRGRTPAGSTDSLGSGWSDTRCWCTPEDVTCTPGRAGRSEVAPCEARPEPSDEAHEVVDREPHRFRHVDGVRTHVGAFEDEGADSGCSSTRRRSPSTTSCRASSTSNSGSLSRMTRVNSFSVVVESASPSSRYGASPLRTRSRTGMPSLRLPVLQAGRMFQMRASPSISASTAMNSRCEWIAPRQSSIQQASRRSRSGPARPRTIRSPV